MKAKKDSCKRYSISTKMFGVICVVLLLLLVLYITCAIIGYQVEQLPKKGFIRADIVVPAKDCLLIFISVLSTSIVSTLLIDVKEKNGMHKKIIQEEVLLSCDFYRAMDIDQKKKINEHLDENIYFGNNSVLSGMGTNLKRKVTEFKIQEYYFSDYSAIIDCNIDGDKIIKTITKTVQLKSYEEECILNHLELAKNVHFEDENRGYGIVKDSFSININGRNKSKYLCRNENAKLDDIELKSGYNKKVTYYYNEPLKLKKDNPVTIQMSYKTVVSISDNVYCARLPAASQNTAVQFSLKTNSDSKNKYGLVVCGFGFADTAVGTPNNKERHTVNLHFKEWIFPKDGWVIVIQKI